LGRTIEEDILEIKEKKKFQRDEKKIKRICLGVIPPKKINGEDLNI